MNLAFEPIFDEANNIIGVAPANEETRNYMLVVEAADEAGARKLLAALFGNTEEKVKTYSSTRTRSARWRAGTRRNKPKYNWSKKKRNRELVSLAK